MKRLLILTLMCLALSAQGKSNLPPCQSGIFSFLMHPSKWNDCFGTAFTITGDKYVGEFKGGKLNGQGTYYFLAVGANKGATYVGEFKDGREHGQGTLTKANGDKYIGEFSWGSVTGQGLYKLADGRIRMGEWSSDMAHGKSITYKSDGSIESEGIYEFDWLLRAEKINPFEFIRISSDLYPQLANKQLHEIQRLTLENENTQKKQVEVEEQQRIKIQQAEQRQRELEEQLKIAQQQAQAISAPQKRQVNAHALVIGNGAYPGSGRLDNPVSDARGISAKLRGMGFTVTEVVDANRSRMVSSLAQFSRTAANAEMTLLFYSGHGVQIYGTNYVLPIDVDQNDLAQATLQGVSLNSVIEQFMPGKTKLVFLDACRTNPMVRTAARGFTKGLAPISVAEGTLIAYAAKDGQEALDGVGQKNSPFTTALLEHLGDSDDIAVVLRKVREKVMKSTGGKQQPWEYGSLTGGALVLSAIKPK
jgi:hypothetical protein